MNDEGTATSPDQSLTLEAYRTALLARNLEINLFWQRSNYFLVLNTAIAVGFFSRSGSDFYAFGLSLIGMVVAVLWVRINLGSKFWQSRWERRLEIVEGELSRSFALFSANLDTVRQDVRESQQFHESRKSGVEKLYEAAVLRKPSVSKTMTMLSAFFVIVWIAAAVLSGRAAIRSHAQHECPASPHRARLMNRPQGRTCARAGQNRQHGTKLRLLERRDLFADSGELAHQKPND